MACDGDPIECGHEAALGNCEELLHRYQWALNLLFDAVSVTAAASWESPSNIRHALDQAGMVLGREAEAPCEFDHPHPDHPCGRRASK